jgi:hypothetical protein
MNVFPGPDEAGGRVTPGGCAPPLQASPPIDKTLKFVPTIHLTMYPQRIFCTHNAE